MNITKTWEYLVRPEHSIPLSELEVIIAKGQPMTIDLERSDIAKEIWRYWDTKQVEMTVVRSVELAQALQEGDQDQVRRMQKQIGGIDPKYRFSQAVLQDKTLYLALSSTDYATFTGTNVRAISDPAFRERLMNAGLQDFADPNYYFANPLGLCSVLYGLNQPGDARNIYTTVGLRSEKVMIYPNTHHIFGGFIDVTEEGKKVDLGYFLRQELQDEIGLSATEMGEPAFNGIIRQIPSRHPEVICEIPVYLSQDRLQQRWRERAPGKFEHRHLSFYSIPQLAEFLETRLSSIVPAGAAALYEFLRHHAQLEIKFRAEQDLYN